jgi:carboxymethylenebutenolidase
VAPDRVSFPSGDLRLSGQLWKPKEPGRFPAVLFNHGSGKEELKSVARTAERFVAHGYVFFAPYRRGQGNSAAAGPYIVDLMDAEGQRAGFQARERLMMKLLETDHFNDQMAALDWLKRRDDVIGDDISVAGISFGIRAAVNFAGAAMTWAKSSLMRERLLRAAAAAKVPVLFVQAKNDFDTAPTRELCAEMQRKGRQCRTRIYPPYGSTAMEAHGLAYRAPEVWEEEVFRFLKEVRRKVEQ